MSYDFVSLHPPYRQIFDCNALQYVTETEQKRSY